MCTLYIYCIQNNIYNVHGGYINFTFVAEIRDFVERRASDVHICTMCRVYLKGAIESRDNIVYILLLLYIQLECTKLYKRKLARMYVIRAGG